MKTKLIVNPASGQETAIGHLPALNARLREAGDVDIVLTTGEGDASRPADGLHWRATTVCSSPAATAR